MSKVILYIERSLDGYIARENSEIDWLWGDSEEDYGFDSFFSSIDTVVLGKKLMNRYSNWPMNSHTKRKIYM